MHTNFTKVKSGFLAAFVTFVAAVGCGSVAAIAAEPTPTGSTTSTGSERKSQPPRSIGIPGLEANYGDSSSSSEPRSVIGPPQAVANYGFNASPPPLVGSDEYFALESSEESEEDRSSDERKAAPTRSTTDSHSPLPAAPARSMTDSHSPLPIARTATQHAAEMSATQHAAEMSAAPTRRGLTNSQRARIDNAWIEFQKREYGNRYVGAQPARAKEHEAEGAKPGSAAMSKNRASLNTSSSGSTDYSNSSHLSSIPDDEANSTQNLGSASQHSEPAGSGSGNCADSFPKDLKEWFDGKRDYPSAKSMEYALDAVGQLIQAKRMDVSEDSLTEFKELPKLLRQVESNSTEAANSDKTSSANSSEQPLSREQLTEIHAKIQRLLFRLKFELADAA